MDSNPLGSNSNSNRVITNLEELPINMEALVSKILSDIPNSLRFSRILMVISNFPIPEVLEMASTNTETQLTLKLLPSLSITRSNSNNLRDSAILL
jgi:hypothetical protein